MRIMLTNSIEESPIPGHWPCTHRPLLPVCGKPIVVHQIEHFANRGMKQFIIPRSPSQAALRARLGNGQEWGVTIRYSDMTDEELLSVNKLNGTEIMVVAGDTLDRRMAMSLNTTSSGSKFAISSLQDYHRINLAAIRGEVELTLPGRPVHNFYAQSDWYTNIDPHAYIGQNVFLGKHCCVGADSRLEQNCILGNGVLISENVTLSNVTVLPNTYIKAGAHFENAVLYDGYVLSLDGHEAESTSLSISRASNPSVTGLPQQESSGAFFVKERRQHRGR